MGQASFKKLSTRILSKVKASCSPMYEFSNLWIKFFLTYGIKRYQNEFGLFGIAFKMPNAGNRIQLTLSRIPYRVKLYKRRLDVTIAVQSFP